MTNFNPDLVDDLARDRVVLFLGAGVSASALTASGKRMAGWDAFLREAAKELADPARDQILGLLDKQDYLLACELLQVHYAEKWSVRVVDEYGQKATPSRLHRAIVSLGQRLAITTNFDKLLESAWELDPTGTHYPTVISRIDESVFKALKDHSHRYIIKIHGTVDDEKTLVFSRSEYIRLAFGNRNYSSLLENLLLNYTFLFIGFSMDDPAIISLMEMYALRYENARPHYVFASGSDDTSVVEINKRLRKIYYILYEHTFDHAALPVLVEELAAAAKVRRREIFADQTSRWP